MAEIRTAHLMTMRLGVGGMPAIGATPNGLTYRGLRHGPDAVMARVDAEPYDRLNRIIAAGTGYRPPEGPVNNFFEVL